MLELNMVVSNEVETFAVYEKIFDAKVVGDKIRQYKENEKLNEVVFEMKTFSFFEEYPSSDWVTPKIGKSSSFG